jgi:hypothetical protein
MIMFTACCIWALVQSPWLESTIKIPVSIKVLLRYDSLLNLVQSYELIFFCSRKRAPLEESPFLLLPFIFLRSTCRFSSTEHQPPAAEQ